VQNYCLKVYFIIKRNIFYQDLSQTFYDYREISISSSTYYAWLIKTLLKLIDDVEMISNFLSLCVTFLWIKDNSSLVNIKSTSLKIFPLELFTCIFYIIHFFKRQCTFKYSLILHLYLVQFHTFTCKFYLTTFTHMHTYTS